MEAASAKAPGRLEGEVSVIDSMVGVLSTSSTLADSDLRTEVGRGIPLLKAALLRYPRWSAFT